MHPAKSVIFFTTGSGAGYGLLVWLAVFGGLGLLPADFAFGLVAFGVAFGLIVGGLVSSTFHLGHPERAFRAMSQWRSSWLSREGLAAIVTFGPSGLYGLLWVFYGLNQGIVALVGGLGAALALITVYCTAMIYGSLKTIPAWSTWWTRVAYLVFALMTGAVLAWFLAVVFKLEAAPIVGRVALVLVAIGLVVKMLYWEATDKAPAISTAETATGLGKLGKVSLIEAPHSEDNYLLTEMGFQIARKHATKLRRITLVTGFVAPFAIITAAVYYIPDFALPASILAVVLASIGIVTERWLFFAEAKHVVTLYYGESAI